MEDGGLLDPVDETGRRPLPPVELLEGLEVRDAGGEKVGTVAEAVTDAAGAVTHLAVATGWLSGRHQVPAGDALLGNDGAGDFLVLPYGEDVIRELPVQEP